MLENVSACIIAKNEEKNLPRLLNSIKGKFREIILVDTGSTDRTVDIAQDYGCKIFYRQWNGFADARNYAVEKASGEWIWHFDADTELEESEYLRFKTFFNLFNKDQYEGIQTVYKNVGVDGKVKGISTTVHIHKKADNIKWIGKVHEIVVNIDTYTILVPNFQVKVLHYGYSLANVQRDKAKRNLKLIFDELRSIKDKNSIDYILNIFYAIQSYTALASIEKRDKNLKRASKYIEKFYKLKDKLSDRSIFIFLKHFFVYAASVYKNLNNLERAIFFVEEGLKIDPNYPDILYNKAEIYEIKKDLEKAILYYIEFLKSMDKVLNQNLSVISDYAVYAKSTATQKLPNLIDNLNNKQKIIDDIREIWNETRGLHIGLLLYSIEKNNHLKRAESILEKLSRIYNEDDYILSLKGLIFKERGLIDKASEFMDKALIINPLNPQANLFFAEIYEKNGKLIEAINFYKTYLEIVKNIDVYHKVLNLIENLKNP
ncbi:MAG: glycosyltransferase [Endomicrobia bacterium]|nr:glycosyltransferase [Endomicrobiia bacterium]